MRALLVVLAVLVLAFGLGCLNYTTESGAAHHREWARGHGLPEPSYTLFLAGAACTAVGAALAGFILGRRGE